MSHVSAAVEQKLAAVVSSGSADLVLSQFSALTRLAAGSPLLSGALTRAGATDEAKRSLLGDLTKGQLDEQAVDLVVAATGTVTAKALPQALAAVGVLLAFTSAGDELTQVEDGLYSFSKAVRQIPELRANLTNPGISDDAKDAFVVDLLSPRMDARAVELIRTLVVLGHGRAADTAAQGLAEQAAARRHLVVAEVRTAVELDDNRKQALVAAVAQHVGKQVEGRFTVDPAIVGSVIVRIGDEVLDGSVRHRLEQAKVALAGAQH